jgi:protocatechuate 3,4-dioxygenase beta subunit
MKKIHIPSIEVLIVAALLYISTPLYADVPWLHVEGNKIKDPKGNIVVLRGISLIDLGFLEGWQGGAINMIDRLTNKNDSQGNSPGWYPKIVRIPIYPPDSAENWPHQWNPNNDRFYTDLLRPVVDYCAEKDLYVIIDWHYITDTWDKVDQTSEFWEYMAPRFANDSHVFFELFNEPINRIDSDIENWLSVRTDMQKWVDIVRTYAPYNLILVAGPSWSQAIGPAASYPVLGDNIVIVSHLYPSHWRNPSWYRTNIRTCAAVYPILMTEWGFSQSSRPDPNDLLHGSISGYGQPLMDFIEGLQIGYTAWVASYNWGPPMFYSDWTLRCGEGEMGCFVKDALYEKRNDDLPRGVIEPPVDWGTPSTEGFETNDFNRFEWFHSGDVRWVTTRQQSHSGNYCAQSGSISHDESTTLQVIRDCTSGSITFYRKVSSESGHDYLKFYIDGVERGEWSGEQDWAQMSFPVNQGMRTFEWTYSKDGSTSDGADAAWIDDIVFPLRTSDEGGFLPRTTSLDRILIDDFNDGDADGWTKIDMTEGQPYGPGTYDASSGAFHLEGGGLVQEGDISILAALWDESSDPIFSDGFVRAKVRCEALGGTVEIALRVSANPETGYNFYSFFGTTAFGGRFFYNKIVNNQTVEIQKLPANFSFGVDEDWYIEAGAVGDQVSMKVWRVGDPEPEFPQLAFIDGTLRTGQFGIISNILVYPSPESTRVSGTFDDIYFSFPEHADVLTVSPYNAYLWESPMPVPQQEGPYFVDGSPEEPDMRWDVTTEEGWPDLHLKGKVTDFDGLPIPGLNLDFWQADDRGNYDNSGGYDLRGHVFTDSDGKYELWTVVPAAYEAIRTRHLHLKIGGTNLGFNSSVYTTQLYFPAPYDNDIDADGTPDKVAQGGVQMDFDAIALKDDSIISSDLERVGAAFSDLASNILMLNNDPVVDGYFDATLNIVMPQVFQTNEGN